MLLKDKIFGRSWKPGSPNGSVTAVTMRAPCPQCQGKGALGTLGPCEPGEEHWKERCPNCDGRHTTLNMMPCLACQAKGGMGTSGPCGLYDPHFKSRCGACKGRGYSALLGQPPPGFGAQPVMAQPVMAQAVAAPAPSPAVSHRPLLVRSVRWNCTTNGHTWLTRHFVVHTLCVSLHLIRARVKRWRLFSNPSGSPSSAPRWLASGPPLCRTSKT